MQSLLTFSIEAIVVGFVSLMVVHFAVGLLALRPRYSAAEIEQAAELLGLPDYSEFQPAPEPEPAPALCPVSEVVPFVVPASAEPTPVAANWAEFDPFQLRKECAQRGIRWRNARTDGKHLRKAEMVAALSAWATSVV